MREKLTASTGTWSVALTRADYQWRRCDADGDNCIDIPGATASTYTASPDDVGKTLVVARQRGLPGPHGHRRERADRRGRAAAAAATDTPVAITGTPARQQTLQATMPAWDGYPTAYTYEWQRCDADGDNCVAIAGAKGNAYVLAKADEGATIRVKMGATNTTGTGDSTSEPTGAVAAVGRSTPSLRRSPAA